MKKLAMFALGLGALIYVGVSMADDDTRDVQSSQAEAPAYVDYEEAADSSSADPAEYPEPEVEESSDSETNADF